ncbi:MAG: N-acetylmuramoyl-L-alanine amidase [Pseudomonadota bacterium]
MRAIFTAMAIWCAAAMALAQDLSGLARLDAAASDIKDTWFGRTELTLSLSQGVPYRVFSLADPMRFVVDFREVDFTGIAAEDVLSTPGRVAAVRMGSYRPGWSRLVLDLVEPLAATRVEMSVDDSSGRAILNIGFDVTDSDAFTANARPPLDPDWGIEVAAPTLPADDSFVVVIDPGHGGIDPGAVRGGTEEKTLMLAVARDLRDALRRAGGVEVVLTRDADRFVSLPARVALAHQVGADAFISLHADALSQGQARGATVYTLSAEASDAASAQLAEMHDRADILAGVDLSGTDDVVATVLLDIARTETGPRTDVLADALIDAMAAAGGPMNKRPRRWGGFSVLKSADIPSVLVEIGFLSDARDLANLRDPVWRAVMVEALAGGILAWRDEDATMRGLIRQ